MIETVLPPSLNRSKLDGRVAPPAADVAVTIVVTMSNAKDHK
jgi:hypothetical protein